MPLAALTAPDVQKVVDACKTTARGAACTVADAATPVRDCTTIKVTDAGGVVTHYEVDHADGDGKPRTADDIAAIAKTLCQQPRP